MKRSIMVIAMTAAMLAALAAPSAAKGDKNKNDRGKETEVISQSYQVGKHARLSVSNLNGDATITGWSGNTIEVTATKRARSRDMLEQADVHVDMNDDHVRIDVDYDLDGDGNVTFHDGDPISVEIEVKVPRGTEIDEVKLVNGNVEITNVDGDVTVSSVNGEVVGEQLGGEVYLSTVNGDVSLTRIVVGESIKLSSVNGSVTLSLPKKVNAKLSASTIHGDIRGDLGNGVTHAGNSMDAVLGSGGVRIELGTVNGDIRIRRADSKDARGDDDSKDDSE